MDFIISRQTTDWLLRGDPAIRWQVLKDLVKAPQSEILSERKKIGKEGWGRRLLSLQNEDGKWAGQLYNKKWISTTYTLLLLKNLGLIANNNTLKGCDQLFKNGIYNNEEIRFSKAQKSRDNGVTGLVLGILCYFSYPDDRLHNIAEFLTENQNKDGSWFYDNRDGAEKYSFETTLVILNGLYEYSKLYDEKGKVYNAQKRGREFLLKHRLFKNPDNGEIINKKWLLFSFPNYWFYDILAALEYFRKNDSWDKRLEDAVNIVIKKQNNDCTWNLQNRHKGETYFDMEETGKAGRWNTLRALRVLKWRVQN